MIMIKVFKTDVQYVERAMEIVNDLLQIYPGSRATFDLEDEDRILRMEGPFFKTGDIITCLGKWRQCCIYLPFDPGLGD